MRHGDIGSASRAARASCAAADAVGGAFVPAGTGALALVLGGLFGAGCAPPAARPAPPPPPAIVSGPWVLSPEPTRATVAWTTAQPAAGAVAFGTAGSLDKRAQEGEARTDHRVVLTGLSPLTRYRYRVEAGVPAEGAFSTAPDPRAETDARFRVLISGGNRGGNGGDHALVVRAESAEDAQLALHTGDMVPDAADPVRWPRWLDAERDLLARVAFVPTSGNSEIADQGAAYARHFLEKNRPAYKAIDYGPLHLLVLDAFEPSAGATAQEAAISEAQRAWAAADVKALKPGRHLWVLVHQGPYSHPQSPRPGHGGSEAVQRIVASLQRLYPIEAVWSGHESFYERGLIDGMSFFVIGGGGAPLEEPDAAFPSVQAARKALSYAVVEVCGCHVVGKAKDIFGNVLDSFTLSDCPQPCGAPAQAAAPARAPAPAQAGGPAPAGPPAQALAPGPAGAARQAAAPAGAGEPSAAGRPPALPGQPRAIAPDPARTVTTDPIREVAPDPIREVAPDPRGQRPRSAAEVRK